MKLERDEKGRFIEGNPGGPGRPRRDIEAEYLETISNTVTPEDWQQVIRRAVKDAKGGDARAREWLSRYLIGDKAEAVKFTDAPMVFTLDIDAASGRPSGYAERRYNESRRLASAGQEDVDDSDE